MGGGHRGIASTASRTHQTVATRERQAPMDAGIQREPRVASMSEMSSSADRLAGRPLRIGLMLRAVDDVDGQGIYIRELCDALFDLDTHNQYVAFYWRDDQRGRYADRPNVREVVLPGR